MDDNPKSSGERHIESLMAEISPGSDRYQVLETAKRFKSSWVELGEQLMMVRNRGLFQQWGYENFEDYCSREIRIKKPTAQKLVLAYNYMEKNEPELVARRSELKPLPDFRSVDLLRQAREEKDFSEEEYNDLRKAIVEEDRSHPTILKRFKEVAAAHDDEPEDPALHYRACLNTARRLEIALRSIEDLPEGPQEEVSNLVGFLEERLAEVQAGQDEKS